MARRVARPHARTTLTGIALFGLCVLALALAVGACSGEDASSSGGEVFAQREGEILLEPSGVAGPDSFAGETFVAAGPTTTFSLPTGPGIPQIPTRSAATTTGGGVEVPVYSGDTPALYGGSRGKASCDKEAQLSFLEQNPDKAAAFCEALNADPTLLWNGGNQVRPDQLRDYFAELTPMILTHDTRVTNHGYRDGHPTPRQSVLQAGQGVLVDRYGVIRVRCECGNPLTPPRPVAEAPVYTGPEWEGFDPSEIVVVQQSTAPINSFLVVDVETGETFERPAGSSGEQDVPVTTTTASIPLTASAEPAPVTVPKVEGLNVEEARAELSGLGLRWTISYEETRDEATGTVLKQEPVPGQEMAPGGFVELVVAMGSSSATPPTTATTKPPTTTTTRPPTTATTKPPTTTTTRPPTTATTKPPTTTTTQPPTTTTSEALVKVPGVKGVGLERAISLLDSAGLRVKLYRDIPGISYLVTPANPMDQRPSAGTLVPRGHVVELRVYGLGENYPIWPY